VTIGEYSTGVEEEATVPITVYDAENIAGGVVKITFNPAVVSAEEVIAGDFNAFMPLINNSNGWVKLVAASATAANKNEAVLGNVIFKGVSTGTTDIQIVYASLNEEDGRLIMPEIYNGSIEVSLLEIPVFPGYTNPPTDLDQDGFYEDINGNGMLDFDDVVVYYDNMEWIEENAPVAFFDCNNNGLIDFDDVVKLYDML